MFERLQFSIPITITIAAPVDIVWDCLCDIQSYSSILSSVVSVESQPRAGSTVATNNKGDGNTVKSNASVDDQSTTKINNSNNRFLGSRWKITRISVLENQTYEAPVTITQHTITEQSRILTFSTHEMLGATCSLKLIVEPGRNSNDSSVRSTDEKEGGATSERRDSGASASSQSKQQQIIDVEEGAAGDTKEACCYLTVIMTMVPYRFFVKLLGVMCCICLLKWRARIAMECDLEDVTVYCEEKYEKQLKEREGGSKRGGELESLKHRRRRRPIKEDNYSIWKE